jgi:predicted nucleic acid-binding Zn ribbon protein
MSQNRSTLSQIVEKVLSDLKDTKRLSKEEIVQVWNRLVGKEAAQHSWPVGLRSRRLVVEVENSGWMHALGLRRKEILEGLVELLGMRRVKELSFRIGHSHHEEDKGDSGQS